MREIVSTIKVGDIIEIVRHDENSRMNLRRVRVRSVRARGSFHHIIGSNLHDENAWDYQLPLQSWGEIVCEPGNIGWFPFVEDEEFDG